MKDAIKLAKALVIASPLVAVLVLFYLAEIR